MKTRFLPQLVGTFEAACLRLFFAATVVWSIWTPSKYDRVEDPSGLASWGIPVAWIGQDGVHPWLLAGTMVAGLIYLLGVWKPGWLTFIGLAGMSVAHLGYWTLANSQGNTFHGSQMTSMVLVAQLAGWIIMKWRSAAAIPETPRWPGVDSILLYFSQCAIVGVYVTSAITKVLKSGGRWLIDSHYFAKSVQKVWRQQFYNNPSSNEFSGISPWASWLAEHPMSARLLFAPGFFLEFFAFLMLWNRAWAAGFGASLVLMHVCIGFIMQLYFPEFEVIVLIFCVNLPYWLIRMKQRETPAMAKAV